MNALPFVTKLAIGLIGGAGVLWLMFKVFNGYIASTIEAGNLRAYERSEQTANETEQSIAIAMNNEKTKAENEKDNPYDL